MWEQLYEFPDYDVNDEGQIRNSRTGRILRVSSNGQRVIKVVLTKDKKTYTRSVAKLVATHFHGDPNPGCTVIHRDGDHTNLHKDNLEWKPRWFAQMRSAQAKRDEPMRRGPIRVDKTGEVYENSLACARAIDGIERYIVLCAGGPSTSTYMGSSYTWV